MAFSEFCWYTAVSKPWTLRTTHYPFDSSIKRDVIFIDIINFTSPYEAFPFLLNAMEGIIFPKTMTFSVVIKTGHVLKQLYSETFQFIMNIFVYFYAASEIDRRNGAVVLL
jgi:hypothetical protein